MKETKNNSRGPTSSAGPTRVAEPAAPPYPAPPPATDKGRLKDLADRSKWPPELRQLIEEMFPEEGKEERIRRAKAIRRDFVLGEGLSSEEVRYFAEDIDLEYDV